MRSLTILTVCTHNRTRSVMTMALLQAGFDVRVGSGRVAVESLGFGPEGLPPIGDAVDAMGRRDLDISAHRSGRVTADRAMAADLILASEKAHVVAIAAASPEAFGCAFTLPEFCARAASDPVTDGRSLRDWVADLSAARTAGEYLRGDVPEVEDPTGRSRRGFEAAVVEIEEWCTAVVGVVSRSIEAAVNGGAVGDASKRS